jgi:hypothetical protein
MPQECRELKLYSNRIWDVPTVALTESGPFQRSKFFPSVLRNDCSLTYSGELPCRIGFRPSVSRRVRHRTRPEPVIDSDLRRSPTRLGFQVPVLMTALGCYLPPTSINPDQALTLYGCRSTILWIEPDLLLSLLLLVTCLNPRCAHRHPD